MVIRVKVGVNCLRAEFVDWVALPSLAQVGNRRSPARSYASQQCIAQSIMNTTSSAATGLRVAMFGDGHRFGSG